MAELVGEPGDQILHGDLHYGNVLAPVRRGYGLTVRMPCI